MPDSILNRHPQLASAVAGGLIVLALSVVLFEQSWRKPPASSEPVTKAFYSDDDGKTWFIDDVAKVVPFDHHGRRAVRAKIFRCADGRPFVGYLEQYSDAVIAKTRSMMANHPDAVASVLLEAPTQVKKPGKTQWVAPGAASQGEYSKIIILTCPENEAEKPAAVSPSDVNNGASS